VTAATSIAAPERARWPRLAAAPHPQLRSLLLCGYAGYTEATTPWHLILPARLGEVLHRRRRDGVKSGVVEYLADVSGIG